MIKYDFTSISSIIAEMVVKNATEEELRRAIAYSAKLLDCEKAYVKNDIQALIEKYCVEEPVKLTEHEKAYVKNDIKACEEKENRSE